MDEPAGGDRGDRRADRSGKSEGRAPIYHAQAAQYGENDIGDSYVEIDLTNQHLWVYEDGVLVEETDFVSGNVSRGYNTPVGIYGITYKERNTTLRGANYASKGKLLDAV